VKWITLRQGTACRDQKAHPARLIGAHGFCSALERWSAGRVVFDMISDRIIVDALKLAHSFLDKICAPQLMPSRFRACASFVHSPPVRSALERGSHAPAESGPQRGFSSGFTAARGSAVARVGPGLSQIAAASARSRSGASTEPRYSPLLRIMMTRQLRRLAGLSSKTFRPLKTSGLFPQPEAAVCRRERHRCDAETDYYHNQHVNQID
jgi:hypothetical protein